MTTDNRSRNVYFSTSSVANYFLEYKQALSDALNSINPEDLRMVFGLLQRTQIEKGRVFVAGNGGSASIADHLNCDFTKGIKSDKSTPFRAHSLVGSMSLFSALANDVGYENTFVEQLEIQRANTRDSIILISSSGNSPNIVKAAEYSKINRVSVIGLSGFGGGRLKELADAKIHVPVNNYGIVEDCHQIIMHVLAQYEYRRHQ